MGPILRVPAPLAAIVWLVTGCFGASAQAEVDRSGLPPGEGPIRVRAGFYLTDITEIDEEREVCTFEGTVTLSWRDPRQAFDPRVLGARERIYQGSYAFTELFDGWWPQLVQINESGEFLRQGSLLRINREGQLTYIEEIDTVAKSPMQLGRFPFDRQTCIAVFEVFGFSNDEVQLVEDPGTTGSKLLGVSVAEWRFRALRTSDRVDHTLYADLRESDHSTFLVTIDLQREAGFMLRLVIAPLVILVMLSWSVFWMDRASLGDRMDISFIGILSVVAFQIVISEDLPRISYFTLMDTFLYINYFLLFGSVIVNLRVGWLDQRGRQAVGDRLDFRCRWLFPLSYVGLLTLAAFYHLGGSG